MSNKIVYAAAIAASVFTGYNVYNAQQPTGVDRRIISQC